MENKDDNMETFVNDLYNKFFNIKENKEENMITAKIFYSDDKNSASLTYETYNYLSLKDFVNKNLRSYDGVVKTLNRAIKAHPLLLLNSEELSGIVVFVNPNGKTTLKDVDKDKIIYDGVCWDGAHWQDLVDKNKNLYEKYVGKVITFQYRKGSKPGSKRVLTVKEVSDTTIKGIDAQKGETGEWRQFLISEIVPYSIVQVSE